MLKMLPIVAALLMLPALVERAQAAPVTTQGLSTLAPPSPITRVVVVARGPHGGVYARGPRGGAYARGPHGGVYAHGPYRGGAYARGAYRVGGRYYGGVWYGPVRRWYGGRWWPYGVGSCWAPSPIGFVWICG